MTLESKLLLGLKPFQRKSSDAEVSNLAHKLAFLVRRNHGTGITSDQISVVFRDRCGHKPEGANMLKCVNIYIHFTVGKEGVEHFKHVRGLLDDDLVYDLHKEVDTMCF